MVYGETEEMQGIVIKAQSGRYFVQSGDKIAECTLRGKVKREFQSEDGKNIYKDPVAVGDNVIITVAESDKGAIERVLPRKSKLSRIAPGSYVKLRATQVRVPRRVRSPGGLHKTTPLEQIIVANADYLLIVLSTKEPRFNLHLLDRFLVVSEAGNLEPIICINKMDLLNAAETRELHENTLIYGKIGYKTLYTSAVTGEGVQELIDLIRDKLTALAGPSGTGKSTLLNQIQPGLQIRTGGISDKTSKGKHTTTNVELHPLDFGGFVVDTPGVRELGIWDIWKDEMHNFFPDISPYVVSCRFSNCSHTNEQGCAVREAVNQGKIARSRYESYMRLLTAASKGQDVMEKFSDRRAREKHQDSRK